MRLTNKKPEKTQVRIENSLSLLLKEHPLTQISSRQIASQAGISRSSFYNHYSDKYDVVDRCQQRVFQKLESVFAQFPNQRRQTICQIFNILSQEKLFASLLLPHGSKEIHAFLSHQFQELVRKDLQIQGSQFLASLEANEIHYCIIYLSSAYFNVCQSWIVQGKKESPEQMADFLLKMLTQAHSSSK